MPLSSWPQIEADRYDDGCGSLALDVCWKRMVSGAPEIVNAITMVLAHFLHL